MKAVASASPLHTSSCRGTNRISGVLTLPGIRGSCQPELRSRFTGVSLPEPWPGPQLLCPPPPPPPPSSSSSFFLLLLPLYALDQPASLWAVSSLSTSLNLTAAINRGKLWLQPCMATPLSNPAAAVWRDEADCWRIAQAEGKERRRLLKNRELFLICS